MPLPSFPLATAQPHPGTSPSDQQPFDLVLEGGSVKGVALVGALAVLEERGYRSQQVAGTSAGAIVAALHASGYSAGELHALLRELDYRRFRDPTLLSQVPLCGPLLSLLTLKGLHRGDHFLGWMRELLAAKGVATFGSPAMRLPDGRPRVKLIVSDVTGRRLLELPHDARRCLGVEPEDLDVALVVRMSMSIPLFFRPVIFRSGGGPPHLLVDGALLSNFPVWTFDRKDGLPPRWPTFGLKLVEADPHASLAERLPAGQEPSLAGYLAALVHTMLEAHDRLYFEQADFARTIPIPTLGVNPTDFNLTPPWAEALYLSGRQAAAAFLNTWNFDQYLAQFRVKVPPSRREALLRAEPEVKLSEVWSRITGEARPRTSGDDPSNA